MVQTQNEISYAIVVVASANFAISTSGNAIDCAVYARRAFLQKAAVGSMAPGHRATRWGRPQHPHTLRHRPGAVEVDNHRGAIRKFDHQLQFAAKDADVAAEGRYRRPRSPNPPPYGSPSFTRRDHRREHNDYGLATRMLRTRATHTITGT